jgi:hypothetical protein
VTVPLIIDLLDENYRILEFPRDYRVDVTTRLAALETLAFLGGATARGQLRETLSQDGDGAIRAGAAQLMASRPGMTPEEDYAAVSEALYRAVRRSSPESEVIRLLTAAQTLSERVWDPENPQLIQALVLIHEGRYSRSVRSTASCASARYRCAAPAIRICFRLLIAYSRFSIPNTDHRFTSTNTIVPAASHIISTSPRGLLKFRARILYPFAERKCAAAFSPSIPRS